MATNQFLNVPLSMPDQAQHLRLISNVVNNTMDGKIRSPCRYVIKRDGLFAGKGVYLPSGMTELEEVLEKIDGKFLVEERLIGTEVSVMGFCNGKDISLFRLHKKGFL